MRVFVYFVQDGLDGPIKIGVARTIRGRLAALQSGNPRPLTLLAYQAVELMGTNRGGGGRSVGARYFESDWHERFAHLRIRGEWFCPGTDLLKAIADLGAGGKP